MSEATQLFVVEDFLDGDLCRRLREAAAASSQTPAKVLRGTESVLEPRMRRATRAEAVPAPLVAALVDRLEAVMPSLERRFGVRLASCQPPTFLIYRKGDHFKVHVDNDAGTGSPEHVRRRKISAVVFLNGQAGSAGDGGFGGGSLNLYRLSARADWHNTRTPVRGREGLFVAFPSDVYHDVTPVTHGVRYTAVSWFE